MSKIRKILLCFALVLSCLLSYLIAVPVKNMVAYASVQVDNLSKYTDVLDDLKTDSSFNESDYPLIEQDYTLQVIQIAESSEKELFVYVYQPCSPNADLTATTINISTTTGEDLSFNNYRLILLSSNGVFHKFKVNGLRVANTQTRIYEISSIFRKWNEKYDTGTGNDNTISEVSFAVAQKFTVKTMDNGSVVYANNGIDVVYITDKWCGFVRYSGGFELLGWADACDSHFVAFNTDRRIDKLLEADVYFVEQMWFYGLLCYPTYQWIDMLSPSEEKNAYLNYTQKGEFTGTGWWASTYKWDRITTVDEFIANENRTNIYNCGVIDVKQETKITDEGLEQLRGKQWVLRFEETAYKEDGTTESHLTTQYIVSDVSILRLKFETDGVVYNLGVVDNKQSADLVPDNKTTYSIEVADWFKIILAVLLLIVLLVILAPVLPIVFNVLWAVLKWIVKVLLWLIMLPFKFIAWLFSLGKKDKSD